MKYRSRNFSFVIAILFITSGCALKTPLIRASASGDSLTVQNLINEGANINEPDIRGYMPLIHAIWSKKTETAKILIDKGADVNAKDRAGFTPLIWAAIYDSSDIVKLLIDKGADIEAKDKEVGYGYSPLIWAASYGYLDIVKLLIDKGANVNARGHGGKTPFSVAAQINKMEILKLLSEKGADISRENINGIPALQYAVDTKNYDMLALIRAKASESEKMKSLSVYEKSGTFSYYKPAKNMFVVPTDREQAYKLAVYDCNRMIAYNTRAGVTYNDEKLAIDAPKNFQKCMEIMGFKCENHYINSTDFGIFTQSQAADSSTVKSRSNRSSIFSWETYSFHSIDDNLVIMRSQYDAGLNLETGKHSFIVQVKFKKGFNEDAFVAFVHLEAVLQPRVTYQLTGEVSEDQVFVWLENGQTGEHVTEKVSAPYMIEPPIEDNKMYPLFFPILGIIYLLR